MWAFFYLFQSSLAKVSLRRRLVAAPKSVSARPARRLLPPFTQIETDKKLRFYRCLMQKSCAAIEAVRPLLMQRETPYGGLFLRNGANDREGIVSGTDIEVTDPSV